MEKYKSRSVQELAETLKTMAKEGKLTGLSAEMNEFVSILRMLKTHKLRHATDAHAFCKCGGLQVLLDLLSLCEVSSRDMVIVLGTVGNLCALDCNSRSIVMKRDGIVEQLVGYLQVPTNPDAAGTAARLLANLALDRAHIPVLHEAAVVRHLSQLLAQGSVDVNCRKNVVRALRLLCAVRECLDELKQNDGVPLLLDCLKSENMELALGALQAVEVVSGEGDLEILQQLCSKEVMQCVVRYCNHSKPKVKHRAMNVLLNSAQIQDGRMALSSAAGVETLVAFMECSEKTSTIFHKVVRALCTCCRDVISRQRLRDCGGLERLITMLADPAHSSLHGSMMAALVCYYFDETTLKLMVTKMGLVQTLCYHLQEISTSNLDQCEMADGADSEAPPSSPETRQEDSMTEMMEFAEDQQLSLLTSTSPLPQNNEDQQPPSSTSVDLSLRKHPTTEQPPSSISVDLSLRKRPATEQPLSSISVDLSLRKRPTTEQPPSSISVDLSLRKRPATEQPLSSISVDLSQRKRPSTDEPSPSTSNSPPPSKRPHLEEVETDSQSTTTPISFLDSLLSSPNPYQTQSSSCHPPVCPLVGDGHSTFEAQVIMMISRMSHMRDCVATLSYPDTVLTLLNFLVSSNPPNNHISKVLTRIFMNPHCFQNCITALVPSKLHQIIRQSDPPPSLTVAESGTNLHRLCRGLLGHIAKNAESPYGQGVLAHLLLRGGEKEKRASCLSMPLLCRCPRVCQKLMVDYGAFQVLCDLLQLEEDVEQWEMAVDAMLALGHNMHVQQVPRHVRRRYSNISPQLQAKKFPFSRLDFSFRDLSLSEPGLQCLPKTAGDAAKCRVAQCRYMDTDFHPFDLTIILHSPSGQTVRVQAHKSTLVEESDVFRVMLAGSYKESSCEEVHIHSVSPCGFLSVLHHMYGCGWRCKEVLNVVSARRRSEGEAGVKIPQSDLLSETTAILLHEIVSSCEDRASTEHCLQVLACAGRFLLPDLITLSEHAAARSLQPGNVVAMFHFAQLHQCFCLAESCIRVLVTIPCLQLRTQVFKELLTSTEAEAALQIILLFLTAADL